MPRKFSGVPHVGRRTETKPDGTRYIYERTTLYDQQTKKVKVLHCKLLGKIPPGETEMIKTRPKRPGAAKPAAKVTAKRTHVGTDRIVEWIGRESGIEADLLRSLPEKEALMSSSLARYLLLTDGAALPRMEGWQIDHRLPYANPITESAYGRLFKEIGENEGWIQQYFACRASRLDKNPTIALDSTTISTYSNNQSAARYGFNKDRDGLPTIKLVTLYSVRDREPIAYSTQPGNIPDVISVQNAIRQLEVLGVSKPEVVTDNGYYSAANMVGFMKANLKFLTLAKRTVGWISPIVEELLPQLGPFSTVCPFDRTVHGKSASLMQEFSYGRKRSRNGVAAGEEQTMRRRVYVHVFRNTDMQMCRSTALHEQISEVRKLVESGVEMNEFSQRIADKYLILSRVGRGGKPRVDVNEEAFENAKKYFGVFVLVSNKTMDTFEALEKYRLREKTEEAFAVHKGNLGGSRPRVWSGKSLRGRQFVQFIGLGYRGFLQNRIKQVKEELSRKLPDDAPAEEKRLREKLIVWLENRSIAQILDWFDCVEETTVVTEAHKRRWTTEVVKRDQLFLRLLGVIQ